MFVRQTSWSEVTARCLHDLGDSADRSAMRPLKDTAARALSERA